MKSSLQLKQLEKLESIIKFFNALKEEHKISYFVALTENLDYEIVQQGEAMGKFLNFWGVYEIENQTIYQHLY